MELNRIRERWSSFSQRPFPKLNGVFDVDDVCLVSADSAVAGCISTFCSRTLSGGLDTEREAILRHTVAKLHGVLDRMPTTEAEEYFRELLTISLGVIEHLDSNR